MDSKLFDACVRGDVIAFKALVEEDTTILRQVAARSLNTPLHLAAKFGYLDLASEIIRLKPELVSVTNDKVETPLHEASRQGNLDMLKLLLSYDPWVSYELNDSQRSALNVACANGRLDVVKHLLNSSWLLLLEEDAPTTSLHAAVAGGHADIVRELLKVRPDFAWKVDENGFGPLHSAASKGHLEIAKELMAVDQDLSFQKDNEGRTPLHQAAIRGHVKIIDEILSSGLDLAQMLTSRGETVLHLSVRSNQFQTVKFLVDKLDVTRLVNVPDKDGNSVLHLAVATKLPHMVKYLLRRTSVDVNVLNRSGFTALDLLETDVSNSSALQLVAALENAGGKRNTDVFPIQQEIKRTIDSSQELLQRNHVRRGSETGSGGAVLMRKTTSNSSSSSYYQKQRTTSRRDKARELNSEGLRSARNKITVVAVLIATVTFAASISPPGGVLQEGPSIGKSSAGKTSSFKLFIISNTLALFLSLAIVTILVSVIPFQEKSMRRLLVVTHKVMWAAASFMVVAYMAAMWVIMPNDDRSRWVRVALLVIAAGTVGTVCVGLGVMLFTHWVKKTEWRKKKRASRRKETEHSMQDRTNSDLDSSQMSGYHLY